MSTAVAVLGALAAACMFGIASVLMFRAASQSGLWWAGAGLQVLSFGVQALALAFGPLALVQPIAATDLLFALPFLARWQGRRLRSRDWTGAGLVAVGVGTFVGISPPRAGTPTAEPHRWVLAVLVVAAVAVVAVAAAQVAGRVVRTTLLALGGAVDFGLVDALSKNFVGHLRQHGLGATLGSWEPYALAIAGVAGLALSQPVGPPGVEHQFQSDADRVMCLSSPHNFYAVGQFYADFDQTSDEQVAELLRRAAKGRDDAVQVRARQVMLDGRLTVPNGSSGVVVFAHGSGSSRHSPRNRYVASALNAAGLGTLLFDLLTVDEEADRSNVFDIELLAGRLLDVTNWLHHQPGLQDLPVGYFGASTGAGAALWAAADPNNDVAAVVSRGGRPDLAGARLGLVRAPTLLIVGGHDDVVIDLNRAAQERLRCESRLTIVPGATHLFEEPGALDEVAALARSWLTAHLTRLPATPR